MPGKAPHRTEAINCWSLDFVSKADLLIDLSSHQLEG